MTGTPRSAPAYRTALFSTTALWLCLATPGAAAPVRAMKAQVAADEAALTARIANARHAMRLPGMPLDAAVQPAQYFPWNNFAPQFNNFPNFPNASQQFQNYASQYQRPPPSFQPAPGFGRPFNQPGPMPFRRGGGW